MSICDHGMPASQCPLCALDRPKDAPKVQKAILTELDALDTLDDIINIVQGKEPKENAIIVGAIVVGIYQVGDGDQTMASRVAVGAMNHFTQVGLHTEILQSLLAEKPVNR